MKTKVTIVDYGIGNLFSVKRAFEFCGAEVRFAANEQDILGSTKLVLPGVGAFADGMSGLADRGLIEAIRQYAVSGGSLLGICLGMQMLASVSDEFGAHSGLAIIPGRVVAIPVVNLDGKRQKIPYVGWAELIKSSVREDWKETILENVSIEDAVYLVHSFVFEPEDPLHRLADYQYNGRRITAAVHSGNVFGTQFHPEKSGEVGLKIIKAFLRL